MIRVWAAIIKMSKLHYSQPYFSKKVMLLFLQLYVQE